MEVVMDKNDFVYVREVLPLKLAVVVVGGGPVGFLPRVSPIFRVRCLDCGRWFTPNRFTREY
jgi:hypothetical protein